MTTCFEQFRLLASALVVRAVPRAWVLQQDPRVTAERGSGIGGSVSNSSIANTANQENPTTRIAELSHLPQQPLAMLNSRAR